MENNIILESESKPFDLFVIGGGVNGVGIARDAAGRRRSVGLAEQGDLAGATSSASTKLFHGGLRYLVYFEFRLVREALRTAMLHISRPMRFVLPCHKGMRFDASTPASKLIGTFMRWLKGQRPAWQIRLGLFPYDRLGERKILPGTKRIDLTSDEIGEPHVSNFKTAFEYSDCWVDDARLVVLNARDAQNKCASLFLRNRVVSAERENGLWKNSIEDQNTKAVTHHHARVLVNAAGLWVSELLGNVIDTPSRDQIRLVRGSHIVTRRLFDHDKAYIFQGKDGRIVFAIPYEQDFILIGTTDGDDTNPGEAPVCSDAEKTYLFQFVSEYFSQRITPDDVVWSYSGVSPLIDDGEASPSAASREYILKLYVTDGAPLLNVLGGKITTYRKLAEAALQKLSAHFPKTPAPWTAGSALTGGDFPIGQIETLSRSLEQDFPFLGKAWANRLLRTYGLVAWRILNGAKGVNDQGQDFSATLTEAELRWHLDHEFAQTVGEVIWRRTKLGFRLSCAEIQTLDEWIVDNEGKTAA